MISAADPRGVGLVASLARPDGNVTGLSFSVGVDNGKVLECLLEAVPQTRRVAILTNPVNPAQPIAIRDLKTAGQSLRLQLVFLEARGRDDFERAFAAVRKERAGAMVHPGRLVVRSAHHRARDARGKEPRARSIWGKG